MWSPPTPPRGRCGSRGLHLHKCTGGTQKACHGRRQMGSNFPLNFLMTGKRDRHKKRVANEAKTISKMVSLWPRYLRPCRFLLCWACTINKGDRP